MSKRSNTKEFIEKSISIHGNLYDYNFTSYINAKTKVTITCSLHGNFEQVPNNHLNGQGCPKCNLKVTKLTTEQFIQRAKQFHKNKYEYSLVDYINTNTKVKIVCKEHNVFKQTPNNHLQGKGCPKCKVELLSKLNKENPTGWSYTNWQKAGERSKNFDSFKVYIIRCWNKNEKFYKIGKTFLSVHNRFSCQQIPYNYEILKTYIGEARDICELENSLQKDNKQFKYLPKNKFDGMYECFSKIDRNGL